MTKPNKPTTIKEIARKLRISPSTVSRALNDHPSIGLVTTMRVKKMAEELKYEPNQTAIFFKQRKTYTIGVLLPDLSEPFFSSAISAIEDLADQHNYTVILGQSLDNPDRQNKIIQTFKKHRVDGVLISLAKNTTDLSFISILETAEIPVVFFDVVPDMEGVNKVQSDLAAGVYEAVDAFISRGHKDIAMINGPENLLATTVRTRAFKTALEKNGISFDNKHVIHSDLTEAGNRSALDQICSLTERPSAILSCSDFITLDVMKYARQKGIAQEIHFISSANYPMWKYIENPPLGCIEQYPDIQGQEATKILLEILRSKQPIAAREIIIPTKLILR